MATTAPEFTFANMFNGTLFELLPGDDFEFPVVKEVAGWEEDEEVSDDPYETPADRAIIKEFKLGFNQQHGLVTQAWAALCLDMRVMIEAIGGQYKMWETINWTVPGGDRHFWFQARQTDEGEGWIGDRL